MRYLSIIILLLLVSCKRNTTYYQCKAYNNGYISFDLKIPEGYLDSLSGKVDTIIVYQGEEIVYIKQLNK